MRFELLSLTAVPELGALFAVSTAFGAVFALLLFLTTGRVRVPRFMSKKWARLSRNTQALPGAWPVGFAAFFTGFGVTGSLLLAVGVPAWLLTPGAFLGGAVFASALVWSLTRLFSGGDREMQGRALIGAVGHLCLAVPEGGTGAVAYVLDGQRRTMPARAVDGHGLPKGAQVMVTDVQNRVALVEEF